MDFVNPRFYAFGRQPNHSDYNRNGQYLYGEIKSIKSRNFTFYGKKTIEHRDSVEYFTDGQCIRSENDNAISHYEYYNGMHQKIDTSIKATQSRTVTEHFFDVNGRILDTHHSTFNMDKPDSIYTKRIFYDYVLVGEGKYMKIHYEHPNYDFFLVT